jgi:hypothetical protein
MLKNILFVTLTFFKFYGTAQNFVTTYSFANVTPTTGTTDPSNSPVANGLIFSSFVAVGTSTNSNAIARFSFTGWPMGAANSINAYTTYTGALSGLIYYQVTINVLPSYTLNLSSIGFNVRRSGTGVRNYSVRSSLDNYTFNLPASTGSNGKLSVIPGNIFFWNYDSVSTASDQKGSMVLLNQFAGITGPVTFRFYAWNSESGSGTFSIDNVTFTGSATNTVTVPNPVGGINYDFNMQGSAKIYPDPNSDGIINVESGHVISFVEVFNMQGVKVVVQEMKNVVCKLDISSQPSGTYFVKIHSGDKVVTKKLILCR